MFNVTRTYPAPASLSAKKKYDGDDVYEALGKIFFKKCYLCETQEPIDHNIEHFRPKADDKEELTYKWENLYYACSRCNNIKLSGFDNILDCCNDNEDVFKPIKLLPPRTPSAKRVDVEALEPDHKTQQTAELLSKIYNSDHTPNKRITGSYLRSEIFKQLSLLQGHIQKYFQPDATEREKTESPEKMKVLINRKAAFSAFARWTILEDDMLGPILKPYMDDQ